MVMESLQEGKMENSLESRLKVMVAISLSPFFSWILVFVKVMAFELLNTIILEHPLEPRPRPRS
jgi:predicted outer membrane lipoprotein